MTLRVLLSPQLQQEWRHDCPGAMDSCVAAETERDHELQFGPSGYAVVDDDAALPRSRRIADATAIAISFQYYFA